MEMLVHAFITSHVDYITPLLLGLHWFPVKAQIEFKILLITFKAIHSLAPKYLCDLLTFKSSLCNLRSSDRFYFLCHLLNGRH